MNSSKINIILVSVLVLLIAFIFWNNHKLNQTIKEERVKVEAETYKTEMVTRQLTREAKDKMYAYRDSIRQATIDEILENNQNLNAKVKQQIKKLKDSPNTYRDSLWIEEWKKVDGPLFDNQ